MASQAVGQRALRTLQLVDSEETRPSRNQSRFVVGANKQKEKRKRVACKECRQAKIRCEGSVSGTNACTRCCRLSLECKVDQGYKRENKKKKIEELEEQLNQLRSAIDTTGVKPMNNIGQASFKSSTSLPQGIESNTGLQIPGSRNRPFLEICDSSIAPRGIGMHQNCVGDIALGTNSTHRLATARNSSNPPLDPALNLTFTTTCTRSLEHITLSAQQISILFQIFFQHYHSFLEILDSSVTPDIYYNRSPTLFWTIISIAARRYEDDPTLLTALRPCVLKLVWASISVLPHTRFTIQAILLLSMWSFPTSSMSTDNSFILISIAKTASMQIGLHRPEKVQDFLRVKTQLDPREFQEAVRIWAGCFITAQSVSGAIGQPSVLTSDWAIEQACNSGNRYTVPDNLRYHLIIQKFIARVNEILGGNMRSPAGCPDENEMCILMKMLEQDFIELETSISSHMTETHSIVLSMACVQLRTYYLFINTATEIRKLGLLKAYTSALDLISKVATTNASSDFIKFAPNSYAQMLMMAALLLMKIINSTYCRYVNAGEGKQAFNSVLSMLKTASVEDNDLRGRGVKILAQLWGVHQSVAAKRFQEPSLNLKTRSGASLLHDSLWIWREEFGGQREASPFVPETVGPSQLEQGGLGSEKEDNLNFQVPMSDTLNSVEGLAMGFPDTDWAWDIGLPSFFPVDIDLGIPGTL